MSDVTGAEMLALKRKLKEMVPPKKYGGGDRAVPRPRPFAGNEPVKGMPDWWGKEPGTDPRLPLKPPGK